MTASLNVQPAKRDVARSLAAHAYRYGRLETDRVDRARSGLNRFLAGPTTFLAARAEINGIRKTQPDSRKVRSDANVTAQMIATLPEELDESKLDEWCATTISWAQDEAPGRLLYAVLHQDEQRPHIHLAMVPEEESGKLNYKALYGGAPRRKKGQKQPPAGALKMTQLQDSYAAAMASLGVSRGVSGNEYKHTGLSGFRRLIEETKVDQARALGRAEARGEARDAAREEVADELTENNERADERVAAAEVRARAAEEALVEVTEALPASTFAVPAPAPPRQTARVTDEEVEGWGDDEPQVEPAPAGPRHLALPAGWFVRLRQRLLDLVNLRSSIEKRFPHLFRRDLLLQACNNVAMLNARAEESIRERESTESVHKSEDAAESVPASESAADYVPDDTDAEAAHLVQDREDFGHDEDEHDDYHPPGPSP